MPNWIVGTLKLRGNSENLKRFFDNAVQPCFSYNPKKQREDFITCHYGEFNEVKLMADAWIENTSRAFVDSECYCLLGKSVRNGLHSNKASVGVCNRRLGRDF